MQCTGKKPSKMQGREQQSFLTFSTIKNRTRWSPNPVLALNERALHSFSPFISMTTALIYAKQTTVVNHRKNV